MKKIEENLNELLEVFNGTGVPNSNWVKAKLEETLTLVKNSEEVSNIPDFDKIVESKVAQYGHTKAAYQFAAEEYVILYRDSIVNESSIGNVSKFFNIDFDGSVSAVIKITNNEPKVMIAINGFGNPIIIDKCKITGK